jgi:hypothetical protein
VVANRVPHQLDNRLDPDLAHQGRAMGLDSLDADPRFQSDFPVAEVGYRRISLKKSDFKDFWRRRVRI